jgi:predicted Zn finger-like uncharacterized protein
MAETTDKKRASCSHCGSSFAVPSSAEGKSAKCPKCGKTFTISFPQVPPPSPAQAPAAVATPGQPQQDRAVGDFAASDVEDRNVSVQTVSSGGIGPPDGAKKTSWPVVIVVGVIGFLVMSTVWQKIYTELAYPVKTKFEIIQDQPINNGSIREVYVRIEKPVTEDQVKAIAYKVRNDSHTSCPKTKVWFLLPAQRIGGGAWASATFRPDLEVQTIGPSVKDAQALKKSVLQVHGETLGEWIHDLGTSSHRITLEKQGNAILIHRTFVGERGDSATDTKTLEILGPNQYRYPGSKESWLRINNQGHLEIHDRQGLVDTARRVN